MISFLKLVRNTIRYWYLPLIAGIIFIIAGIWTFASPVASYLALTVIFSFSFLISGIAESFFAVSNRNEIENWGWLLFIGIATSIIGLVMILKPELSIATLPLYIGFTVMFRAIGAISVSLDLRSYGIKNWGFLAALGTLALLFSFVLVWNPVIAGISILTWTATALLISGIFSIYFSLKLRKLHTLPQRISSELKERYENLREEVLEELHRK